jgi:hypothetical protein
MLAIVPNTFTHAHIAVTAAITGALAASVAVWRLPGLRRGVVDGLAVGVLAGLAVYLWRASANMPQLNSDGIAGYSANDWLAPVVTFVALSTYTDLRPPADPRRYAQIRAAATIIAFAVNVITI